MERLDGVVDFKDVKEKIRNISELVGSVIVIARVIVRKKSYAVVELDDGTKWVIKGKVLLKDLAKIEEVIARGFKVRTTIMWKESAGGYRYLVFT